MSVHKEISFETEVCEYLEEHGWLYEGGDAAKYERDKALFSPDVLAWVQATQPAAWQVLVKNHGTLAGETLLKRLRDQLDQRGTLDVLRHGIELLGLKQPLKLAEFKPALAINPDILARYEQNRLRARPHGSLRGKSGSRRVSSAMRARVRTIAKPGSSGTPARFTKYRPCASQCR